MQKRKLKITGIYKRYPLGETCALILKEVNGKRNLLIQIGLHDAESILMELENIKPARPLMHDLFFSFAEALDATIEEIIIFKYQRGIFYSKIIFVHSGIEGELIA